MCLQSTVSVVNWLRVPLGLDSVALPTLMFGALEPNKPLYFRGPIRLLSINWIRENLNELTRQ